MISKDLKNMGYMFQWSKLDAARYLLTQRRNRVYVTGDLDHGQDFEEFSLRMRETLMNLSGESTFAFEDVFDTSLPKVPLHGTAKTKLEEAIRLCRLHNKAADDVFVDTSTSSSRVAEMAVGVSTCTRPSHQIYSHRLGRCITIHEMFNCQGIWKNDFSSPQAIDDEINNNPSNAQDLCGNAFASTAAQAQLIASLVNATGWKTISGGHNGSPCASSASLPSPCDTSQRSLSVESIPGDATDTRRGPVEKYFTPRKRQRTDIYPNPKRSSSSSFSSKAWYSR